MNMIHTMQSMTRQGAQAARAARSSNQVRCPFHEATVQIRDLLIQGELAACRKVIIALMAQFPDAAQPHNLMGLLLEKEGDHRKALCHFRAALALEPGHRPAEENLHRFSSFFHPASEGVFEDEDCLVQEEFTHHSVHFDHNGVGYVSGETSRAGGRRMSRF